MRMRSGWVIFVGVMMALLPVAGRAQKAPIRVAVVGLVHDHARGIQSRNMRGRLGGDAGADGAYFSL